MTSVWLTPSLHNMLQLMTKMNCVILCSMWCGIWQETLNDLINRANQYNARPKIEKLQHWPPKDNKINSIH